MIQSDKYIDNRKISLATIQSTMNDKYQSDLDNSLKYCRLLLKPLGVWPLIYGHANNLEKFISTLLIAICLLSLSFVLLPGGYYCFFYVKDINVKIKTFGPICYCASCMIKYCYLGIRAPTFKRCIKQIEKDWKLIEGVRHRTIMIDNTIVAQKLSVTFTILLYISAISYHTILPAWSNTFKAENNLTVKPLIYPGYDIFVNAYAAPTYQLIYFMHCVYSFFSSSITAASCTLVAFFVTHACGRIQIQIARLEYLVTEKKTKANRRQNLLAVIVNNHAETLKYSKSISKALQEICFLEVVASTILICTLEYLCIVEWENRDVVAMGTHVGYIFSFTFNILILCYAGELLVEESGKFGDATYNIEWYNLSEKKSFDLILLIAVSKYPPKLTGGKIFEISMSTFSTVLKSSVVYMNLCRAVTEW